MEWLPPAHLAATAAMAGLIWFVQIVHYPLFNRVPAAGFAAYEREHVRRTGWVVGPIMGVEAITAVALALWPPSGIPSGVPVVGVALLAVVWLSTLFLQVPEHRRLLAGPDGEAVRRLVGGNWIRTIAWTIRAPLAAWMVAVG
jgi:hypothetical protein